MPVQTSSQALEAWSRYVDDDHLDLQLVPSEVASSWQGCRSLAVSPFDEPGAPVDPGVFLPVLAKQPAQNRIVIQQRRGANQRRLPALLRFHTWPGNIRELKNVIERAVIRTGFDGLVTADLADLRGQSGRQAETQGKPASAKSLRESEKKLLVPTLASNHGSVKKTALELEIGRNALYRKMREYGIGSQR